MPRFAFLSVLTLAVPIAAAASDGPRPPDRPVTAQYTIHERIVIRVPRMSVPGRQFVATPASQDWKERKGPACIGANDLAGALVVPDNAVDLVLRGGQRVRAKLEGDCRQLDFYSGFYLRPAGDGSVCAGRDMVYIRSGASCGIRTFKTLRPKRRSGALP